MKILVTKNTSASGVSLQTGQILTVPDEISESDARTLMAMRKATEVKSSEVKSSEVPDSKPVKAKIRSRRYSGSSKSDGS